MIRQCCRAVLASSSRIIAWTFFMFYELLRNGLYHYTGPVELRLSKLRSQAHLIFIRESHRSRPYSDYKLKDERRLNSFDIGRSFSLYTRTSSIHNLCHWTQNNFLIQLQPRKMCDESLSTARRLAADYYEHVQHVSKCESGLPADIDTGPFSKLRCQWDLTRLTI